MPVIRVGTNNYGDYLRDRLNFELEFLKEDGIEISIDEIKQGDSIIFKCDCVNDQKSDFDNLTTIFIEYIANVLSDVIINFLETDLLYKILYKEYKYFSQEKYEKIIDLAMDRLNFLISKQDQTIVSKIQRKNKILLEIVDYLQVNKEIILEGFIRFRLKNYLSELKLAIDRAVDDFIVEQEYEEFVYLLKYFIDNQEIKNELINVVKISDNSFKLLDEVGIFIENTYLDEYVMSMVEPELDYEDLLISALITAAPEEIILHFTEPISLIKTLKNIFTDKISICLGCEYCEINSLNELD